MYISEYQESSADDGKMCQKFGSVVQAKLDFEQQALNQILGAGGDMGGDANGLDDLDDLDFEKEESGKSEEKSNKKGGEMM